MHVPASIEFEPNELLNARVRKAGGRYLISISNKFDATINNLMAELVNSPDVLPWLTLESPERSEGAKVLTRLCMEFVLAHEHGHIIGGHVDQLAFEHAETNELLEFNVVSRDDDDPTYDERSQAWEYEADTIGAALIDKQIDELIASAKSQKLTDDDRTFLGAPEIAVEHIGALAIAALYVLFRLLRKNKDELILVGHHPDPLVRAFICRDVINHRLVQRHDFDQGRFKKLMHYHLEAFDWALEDIGYAASQMADDEGVDQVNAALESLAKLQRKYHHTIDATRWTEWSMSQI
ncbi:MAG: hypothetical protein P8Q23_10125 [Paracoccaceae bacterium]|nr:hypothetical protein [Paracoccaceae bacterium]